MSKREIRRHTRSPTKDRAKITRLRQLIIAGLLALTSPLAATEQQSLIHTQPEQLPNATPTFDELLAESAMRFEKPEGFVPIEARPNSLFRFDHAVGEADGSLEIRYVVRPIKRIIVDYEDPHSSTPDPNHMFPLMFQSLVTMLSGGGHSPTREYPLEQARAKFNADWAAASVFDNSSQLNVGHKQALLIAMHKNGLADAYVIFLFDEYQQVANQINTHLDALRFRP